MNQKNGRKNRENEKGAALVMVLLVTSLLLVAAIGLLLETAVTAANVTDAVAEQQAYNAAESGIQSAINVLRAHNSPSPLIDPGKPASHQNNRMDFVKAVKLTTSNQPGDTSAQARLSRWMPYSATTPDRVQIGGANSEMAYSLTVRDPDNPLQIIKLTTTGKIDDGNPLTSDTNSRTFSNLFPLNSTTIKYNAVTTADVDVSTSAVSINLGTFTVTRSGSGSTNIPSPGARFEITVKMTKPLPAAIILRGTIKPGTISNTNSDVNIEFDSPAFNLLGSIISVVPVVLKAPNNNSGVTNLGVTVTLSQPKRLVIRSVGYGPRGARKEMEAVVERDVFDGLIPATITLVGNTVGSVFKPGCSSIAGINYSGGSPSIAKIPPVGTTGGGLLSIINASLSLPGCTDGDPADVSEELPDWLKSTDELNDRIGEFKEIAKSSGRYFASGQTVDGFGDNANGTGITFIDGDANLTGAGGGIMVVTGKLNLKDASNFNGTILVTGVDGVKRSGSGGLSIDGNLIVAPYNASNLAAGFLPPKYDITGGTVSSLVYKAQNILFGSNRVNTVVVGVAEK